MPLYDYVCEQEHETEAKAGFDVKTLPCLACGQPAQRVPFYENQYIIGATVAKYRRRDVRAPTVSRLRLDNQAEAQKAEVGAGPTP